MAIEEIDDSFKKPGAVPFKWETRPGVPKIQLQQKQQHKQLSPPTLPPPSQPFNHHRISPAPAPQHKLKLKPPPAAGSIFLPPPQPRAHSFRSSPRIRSERWRFEQPSRVRTECVSPGCFPSPLLRRKESKKRTTNIFGPAIEPNYTSDLETFSRWSISSRKSFSSFRDSPTSSYSSYDQSSPRPVSDAEWAGFGLF